MKKTVFSIIALTSFTASYAEESAITPTKNSSTRHVTDFKKKSDLIAKVDGNLIGASEIHDSLRAINAIVEVLFGTVDKTTKKRIGTYKLGNDLVTVQDLAKKELALIKEGVGKADARRQELDTALTTAKDDFNSKLKALRKSSDKESDMAKNMKNRLIKIWLEDQNIQDSLLANSDKDDEKERMYAASAPEFFRFLTQLKYFLEDLTSSCPKAHEQYKAVVRQAQQK